MSKTMMAILWLNNVSSGRFRRSQTSLNAITRLVLIMQICTRLGKKRRSPIKQGFGVGMLSGLGIIAGGINRGLVGDQGFNDSAFSRYSC